MKLDVLALRNLDMAADAIALIEEQTGERIDLAGIPDGSDTTDPRVQATWRLLQGRPDRRVFQMESAPMAQLARDVRPTHIDDLSAVIALYRPGRSRPACTRCTRRAQERSGAGGLRLAHRRPGRAAPHRERPGRDVRAHRLPGADDAAVRLVAGFDAKERSKLRKAVGKKLKDQMAEVGQMLLDRAEQEFRDDRGQVISPSVSRATVQRLYDAIKARPSTRSTSRTPPRTPGWRGRRRT